METMYLLLCKALSYTTLIFQGILGLSLIVVFHEFGHLLCAKLFNVYAPAFSIGYGPRLFEFKIGETTFALRAIPLGGYVEIAASPEPRQGEESGAFSTDDRSLASKPYWQKMLILLTGILFNGLFATLALTLLSYQGMPCPSSDLCYDQEPIIFTALPDSEAAKSGLQSYDKIIAINSTPVRTIGEVTAAFQTNTTTKTTLLVERSAPSKQPALSTKHTFDLKREIDAVSQDQKAQPRLAQKLEQVGITWYMQPTSLMGAIKNGWRMTLRMIAAVFSALRNIFHAPEHIGGPLLIIFHTAQCAKKGLRTFLFILAFLSINLGVLNLLPIPPLDGSHALIYTIEALTGRELSLKTRESIAQNTFYGLILFIIFMTYRDAVRIGRAVFGKKTVVASSTTNHTNDTSA